SVATPIRQEEEVDEELDDDRPTLIHEPSEEPEEEGDDDRPTIASDPLPQFEDETRAFDLSSLASEVDAEFAAQAKLEAPEPAPVAVDTSAIGRAAPLSLAQMPQVDAPSSEAS